MCKTHTEFIKKYVRSMLFQNLVVLFSISTFVLACTSNAQLTTFDYGTKNDSARYYFFKGFEEILDNHRWTESEKYFRKAVEFDSNWLLGKSLIARITRNLSEREQLLQDLNSEKYRASEYERLLLDVNLLFIEAYNNRDKRIQDTVLIQSIKQIAEANFGKFSRKYPDDNYFKAEYIELLHANHGAKLALDSLRSLATETQLELGFYIAYSAELELELGHIEKAILLSDILRNKMIDSTYTSYMMLKAKIYIAQDSLEKAKEFVNKAVRLDSK